jgi:hypothetical protein
MKQEKFDFFSYLSRQRKQASICHQIRVFAHFQYEIGLRPFRRLKTARLGRDCYPLR